MLSGPGTATAYSRLLPRSLARPPPLDSHSHSHSPFHSGPRRTISRWATACQSGRVSESAGGRAVRVSVEVRVEMEGYGLAGSRRSGPRAGRRPTDALLSPVADRREAVPLWAPIAWMSSDRSRRPPQTLARSLHAFLTSCILKEKVRDSPHQLSTPPPISSDCGSSSMSSRTRR